MKNDMETCEVCGKQKAKSEMSKSYKHRCKKCVAERTRQVRTDVRKAAEHAVSEEQFRMAIAKDIDWEQRRYDLIRDFYLKWTDIEDYKNDANLELRFDEAIKTADALINRLKKEQNEDNVTK